MSVNLDNVNISLAEFQKVASGHYNAGEVALSGEGKLRKINNHVTSTGKNTGSLDLNRQTQANKSM